MELLNPLDRIKLRDSIRTALPFPHFCIDNFLNVDFANEIHDAFPTFQDSRTLGREFSSVNEKLKIQITDSAKFPPPIARLNTLLASPEFLDMMSELMGIPALLADDNLDGGGIHETNSGGRLDVHVDFNLLQAKQLHRRLNILIYFNKDWKEEYGGYLDIWDKDVKQCHGAFAPVFNRAFCFATSEISYHGVTPVTCPPGVTRKSFAAYYYTREAPEGWDGKVHSTVFKARPDEWLRRSVLMPGESTLQTARRGLDKVKKTIKGIVEK